MPHPIRTAVTAGVLIVTLDRPRAYNAFDREQAVLRHATRG